MRVVPLRVSQRILAASLSMVVAAAAPAVAQSDGSKWEIEIHGSGIVPTRQGAGVTTLPPIGATIETAGIYGPPAPPVLVVAATRRISSWYFGDGAVLFDQAATAVAANPVAMTAPFPGRIVALDPVLRSTLGDLNRSGGVGLRISRTITPRFSAELSIDYSLARLKITDANRAAIEATRASFIPALQGVIASNTNRTVRSLTSVANLDDGSAHYLYTSGVLIVNLKTTGRVTPYAAIGGGLISVHGDLPDVALTGNYQFANNVTGASFNETDAVTVNDVRDTRMFAGVLGGGVKLRVSSRWGIRVDTRVFLSGNPAATTLDATPNVTVGQLPAGRVTLNSNPTIQFGNSNGPITGLGVTAPAPSTLTGPALTQFRTFSGSGVSTHSDLAVGMYWRF